MNHLEELICQYYDWQGYVVKRNVRVGRLRHGGWEGELDIVAYRHPANGIEGELVHLEPSIDADPWAIRETRFRRKFEAGRKHIFASVFPWLDATTPIKHIAVFVSRTKNRESIAGGEIKTVDEFMTEIATKVRDHGKVSSRAISEQYALLRTIQLVVSGYYHEVKLPPLLRGKSRRGPQ